MNMKYVNADALLAWYDERRAEARYRLMDAIKWSTRRDARNEISLLDQMYFKIRKLTEQTPDVEEVRHGKLMKTGRVYPYCSECDANLLSESYRYCPWCDAKLDKEQEKMSRYIDAEELYKEIDDMNPFDGCNVDVSIRDVLNKILKAPTVNVKEVKHGKWVEHDGMFYCSECNFLKPYDLYDRPDNVVYWECDYCRICGAKMDKEEEE